MSGISNGQVVAIHALKGRLGLDDEGYRDLLRRETGAASSKGLTWSQASAFIDRMKVIAGQKPVNPDSGTARQATGSLTLEGPFAGKMRALWISGWHLGVFADRHDTGLQAFVRRQLKIDHPTWVRDHEDAVRVIEGLKAWMAREAGVQWPGRATASKPNGQPLDLNKLAVVQAQLRILDDNRRLPGDVDLDAIMAELGRAIRKRKAASEAAARSHRREADHAAD